MLTLLTFTLRLYPYNEFIMSRFKQIISQKKRALEKQTTAPLMILSEPVSYTHLRAHET